MTIDASMLADGITIDASGNDTNPSVRYDGGTSVFDIDVTLSSSEIKEVSLKNLTLTGADQGTGGAIVFDTVDFGGSTGFAILRVEDCTIEDNHAEGGGIWAEFGALEVTRTVIRDNTSLGFGGGIFLRDVRSAIITDSQIVSNEAGFQGGGLWAFQEGRGGNAVIKLENTLVAENELTNPFFGEEGQGGGLWVDLHAANGAASLEIVNSLLIDNHATNEGGGAYIEGKKASEVTIVDTSIIDNTAGTESEANTGKGGGVYIGHEPFEEFGFFDVSIEQTTISGNEALDEGGGLWLGINNAGDMGALGGDLDTTLDFVTIHDNAAPDGGGLFSMDDVRDRNSTILTNTIVSGNETAPDSGVWNNIAGQIAASSSFNLWGTSTATLPTGTNLFSNAPGLRPLADNGGRRLPNGDPMLTHQPRHDSPAIDAGDPSVTFNANEFDQRGPNFFRVFNQPVTNANRGPVDIGAIELGTTRVLDVTIREEDDHLHGDFSFAEGTFQDEPMIGSGNQLRTVPIGGADEIEIRFSEEMPTSGTGAIGINSLSLQGLAFNTIRTPTTFDYDEDTFTATWTFTDPLPADQYVILVPDSVKDMSGNELDGEWTNPFSIFTTSAQVSEFPSGDGAKGGDFAFVMTILPGDHDRDNAVDGISFLHWQQMVGSDKAFEEGDFNGDGDTDGDDLAIYNANYGKKLYDLYYADFNRDGIVNNLDYAIWTANYGNTNASHAQGDASRDGSIYSDDYVLWQQQIGLEIDWVL